MDALAINKTSNPLRRLANSRDDFAYLGKFSPRKTKTTLLFIITHSFFKMGDLNSNS
jgi:hypothetical protein